MRNDALPTYHFPDHSFLARWLRHLWMKVRHWSAVSAQRRELRELDERALKDMGISRSDAIRESSRHFWDETHAA